VQKPLIVTERQGAVLNLTGLSPKKQVVFQFAKNPNGESKGEREKIGEGLGFETHTEGASEFRVFFVFSVEGAPFFLFSASADKKNTTQSNNTKQTNETTPKKHKKPTVPIPLPDPTSPIFFESLWNFYAQPLKQKTVLNGGRPARTVIDLSRVSYGDNYLVTLPEWIKVPPQGYNEIPGPTVRESRGEKKSRGFPPEGGGGGRGVFLSRLVLFRSPVKKNAPFPRHPRKRGAIPICIEGRHTPPRSPQ